jgi:hypothetical protein
MFRVAVGSRAVDRCARGSSGTASVLDGANVANSASSAVGSGDEPPVAHRLLSWDADMLYSQCFGMWHGLE